MGIVFQVFGIVQSISDVRLTTVKMVSSIPKEDRETSYHKVQGG